MKQPNFLSLRTLWKEYHRGRKDYDIRAIGIGLLDKSDIQTRSETPHKNTLCGTSHHLGLNTHDYGLLNLPMESQMVFTVEPGIYIPEEGFGIRLEDDVVIQNSSESR